MTRLPDDTLLQELGNLAREEDAKPLRLPAPSSDELDRTTERVLAALSTPSVTDRSHWLRTWLRKLRSRTFLVPVAFAFSAASWLLASHSHLHQELPRYELSVLRTESDLRSDEGALALGDAATSPGSEQALRTGAAATLLLRPATRVPRAPAIEVWFGSASGSERWPVDSEVDASGAVRLQLVAPNAAGVLQISIRAPSGWPALTAFRTRRSGPPSDDAGGQHWRLSVVARQ